MSSFELADRCDFKPGDLVDGKYSVKKSLGEGSFGAVYLVEDLLSHQPYALKLLRLWDVPSEIRQPLKDRFKMEFETGQIACENLVQSLGYGYVKGNPFILMEFCPGGDLTPYLGQRDVDAFGICHDILNGLCALHNVGKVHRDLKPENVLFKKDDTVALTDFGIVGDSHRRLTHVGIFGRPDQVFGTYAYMPPEQANRARGGVTVLPTTDVFSFGVLAYQLLTGKYPFGALESHNDLAEYLGRAKKGIWDSGALRHVPDGDNWAKLLAACLMPDYRERIPSANELIRLLPPSSRRKRMSQANIYDYRYKPVVNGHGYCLRILQGEEYGRNYDLTTLSLQGHRLFTVGRSKDNCIRVKSDTSDFMSRHHCTIETIKGGSQWIARDGQWIAPEQQWRLSRNGTYVNWRPITSKGYYLQPGDIITMGDITMRFEKY